MEEKKFEALLFDGSIDEGMLLFKRVGCWYADSGESGYVNSGLNPHKTIAVYCRDGYFFKEVADDEYTNIIRRR